MGLSGPFLKNKGLEMVTDAKVMGTVKFDKIDETCWNCVNGVNGSRAAFGKLLHRTVPCAFWGHRRSAQPDCHGENRPSCPLRERL